MSHSEQKGTDISYTVLQPGNFLSSQLWKDLESVVLTSATLQMGDDFTYMKQALDLQNFETLLLPSDFNYEKQALLYIPQDLGSIKYNISEVIRFLEKFFLVVQGRTLVLFTSYANIKETFVNLKTKLQHHKITLL